MSDGLGPLLVAALESAIAVAGGPWKFVARQNVRAEKGSDGKVVSVSTVTTSWLRSLCRFQWKNKPDKKIKMLTPKSLPDSVRLELSVQTRTVQTLKAEHSHFAHELLVCGNADGYLLKET